MNEINDKLGNTFDTMPTIEKTEKIATSIMIAQTLWLGLMSIFQ